MGLYFYSHDKMRDALVEQYDIYAICKQYAPHAILEQYYLQMFSCEYMRNPSISSGEGTDIHLHIYFYYMFLRSG